MLFVGICLCALGASAPALAGSKVRARRFFKQAQELFEKGEYDKAAVLYESAYREKPLPALLINIGQCYRKQNNCEKATSYYERYLTDAPNGPHRESVQELIKRCREEQASSNLVDEPGTTPAAGESPPAQEPPPPPPPPPAPPSKGLHPIYFWSAVGVSGALLLMGTVTGGLALSKSSEYKDPATPAADAARLKDQGEDLKVASTVTFIVGATAAAGAAVLYFFTDFKRKELGSGSASRSTAVAGTPLPGGGLVSVGGSF